MLFVGRLPLFPDLIQNPRIHFSLSNSHSLPLLLSSSKLDLARLVMGLYRRLIYDAFRRKTSFISRSNPTTSRISQPILRNSVLQNVVRNQLKKSPFFDGAAKRFYSGGGIKAYKLWYDGTRIVISLIHLPISGAAIIYYYWYSETVPFTKRRHFITVSPREEKRSGELAFQKMKSGKSKGKILPSHHPESVRVGKIGRDIIGALLKRLNKLEDGEQTAHLEGLHWEFLVLDNPNNLDAVCLPAGKIIVCSGLLNYLETDAEIAAVIGHEVGHVVARHIAEEASALNLLPSSLRWQNMRMNVEADYIGMLISASAGYDPRIAPQVYVKLEELITSLVDVNLFSTHRHGQKRAKLLSQPKVMEEALAMYREALKEKEKDK